jgi:organic radical activating enzyme
MKKSLRLLLFEECNRDCPGCCNKDWDLNSLESETSYEDYDEIILTGGEPMLRPGFVIDVVEELRRKTDAKIYMYTAKVDRLISILAVLKILDGITVTLHTKKDINSFKRFNECLDYHREKGFDDYINKSFRLNVFKGIDISDIDTSAWKVKSGIKWIKNCPLPANEVFKKYRRSRRTEKGTVQLAENHGKYLDERFSKDYPNGQFAIQRIKPADYRMHWSPYRSTRNSFRGISVRCLGRRIKPCNEHNSSVGKWTYYKKRDVMLESAKRLDIPQKLVDTFVEQHINWKEQ